MVVTSDVQDEGYPEVCHPVPGCVSISLHCLPAGKVRPEQRQPEPQVGRTNDYDPLTVVHAVMYTY